MTEVCDSVITEARLLAANGEEGKETATLRVTQNDEGRGVKPDKGEIMATKSNDMDNEKCYSPTSTPILSCGEKQLAGEAIHLPQASSSCTTDTDSCDLTVQDAVLTLDENEQGGAQQPPPIPSIHKKVGEVLIASTEDSSTELKELSSIRDLKNTPPNSDCVMSKISMANAITNGVQQRINENTNSSNCTKQQKSTASERGSQLTTTCIDGSATINAHDVEHDVHSISTPNMIGVREATTVIIPGTEEVVTIEESASVCNERCGNKKLPVTIDGTTGGVETGTAYNSAIVSVTPGGGTTGSIQCTVKDNNSYESSVSVDSVVAPEIKCAPFQPFLSGNLDKGIIQEHSDDPQQLSSLSNAVTPGLFADNLANSFEATEAHVKLLCIQTDLKEDSATVRCGLSKPPAYGEFGGVDVMVFEECEVPPPQMSQSNLEKDRADNGEAMTGLRLQKMLELDEYYDDEPGTIVTLSSGLDELQQMLTSDMEQQQYAPFSTTPLPDPKLQEKKNEPAFEMCAAPFATVGDLPRPQKMPTSENYQYSQHSTITDGLVPQKTPPTVENKHITCAEEVVELVVPLKHRTMLPEECASQLTKLTDSINTEQQLAIPELVVTTAAGGEVTTVAVTPPACKKEEEFNTEVSLTESKCGNGEVHRNATTNSTEEDSSYRPSKRVKFQEEIAYIEEMPIHGMSDGSLPPDYNDDDQQLTERNPYSISSNDIEVATTALELGGVESEAHHNKTVTSSGSLLKETSYPLTDSLAEDTAPDSTNKEEGVDFDKRGMLYHHSSNPFEVSVHQDDIDNHVASDPPPPPPLPPPEHISPTTSISNTDEKLSKAQHTIKDLRDSLAVEKRKRILLAAALSEEARSEAGRTVAKMREEFEAEKNNWVSSGAEHGIPKYEDQNKNQEGIQQFVDDVQRQCENEVQSESDDLRRKWANENEYRNIEEIIRAEFAQRKDLLVLTQAMASEMADSQQRSLNRLREEMRNEMRNEVVYFKEEIRKEVEAGLQLDQEKAVLLAETRLEGEAENLRQELRVAHLKCKELESQCRDEENSRTEFRDIKQAFDKLSNQLSILEPKHRDTIDELAATKTLAEGYRHQLKEMADELTEAKASAEKYIHQIQVANEELVQLRQNQEAHPAVMGELTGLRAQNGLMASSLSRERENSHSLQIKLDNALEQSRSLRQKLVKYKKKEEDLNAAASILVPDQLSPPAVKARTDEILPRSSNFGKSSLGNNGPAPHRAMNGNKDGDMGGVMPVFVEGYEHSPAAFPARETQVHPPQMVKQESQEACTVPPSMPQTFGNEFEQQALGNSTAFTRNLTASAVAQTISTPQHQAAYRDPYSSLNTNQAPKREVSTSWEGLNPFSPQRVPRPRKQQLPEQPHPQNTSRQTLMPHERMSRTTTSIAPLSVHQMTDRPTGGQQKTTQHHRLVAAPTATVHNPYQLH